MSFTQWCILISFAERKLQPNEFPHSLFIRSYSTLSTTCLTIRKWTFSLAKVCVASFYSTVNEELELFAVVSYMLWHVTQQSFSVQCIEHLAVLCVQRKTLLERDSHSMIQKFIERAVKMVRFDWTRRVCEVRRTDDVFSHLVTLRLYIGTNRFR